RENSGLWGTRSCTVGRKDGALKPPTAAFGRALKARGGGAREDVMNTDWAEVLPELAVGDFYYEDLGGGRYRSTVHAQGAWNPREQHMAPASGLLAHALDLHAPREGLRIARLSYEILGMIHAGECEVT